MKTCIISCGANKIWNSNPSLTGVLAQNAYVGGYFNINKRYANHFYEDWFILSAKYGIIHKNFIIPGNYDVSFNNPKSNPVNVDFIQNQHIIRTLESYTTIEVLAGKKYFDILSKCLTNLEWVFKGLPGMGYQQQYCVEKINNDNSIERMFR